MDLVSQLHQLLQTPKVMLSQVNSGFPVASALSDSKKGDAKPGGFGFQPATASLTTGNAKTWRI